MDTDKPTSDSSTSDKVYENRLRRVADRQGLRLEKSRSRDRRALTYGTYHLVNPYNNTLEVCGSSNGYGLSLPEIEHALMT